MSLMQSDSEAILKAVAALRRGECVGLPTETVYGLAADARNPAAIARIFALKGRPANHPLIVHLPSMQHLGGFARDIPDAAWRLAEKHWPGPLTLVLKREFDVPLEVTGGQDTIAVRMPSHPVACAVLREFDGGLAAPSANRFGHISPTRSAHVMAEFGDELPIVLEGGDCAVGIESTIVDFTGRAPRILRTGMLSAQALGVGSAGGRTGDALPRVPGALDRHYAPRTPLELWPRSALGDGATDAAILAIDSLPAGLSGIALPRDPRGYAQGLYAALRELDAVGARTLRVEMPPADAQWDAIHDRLRRASA